MYVCVCARARVCVCVFVCVCVCVPSVTFEPIEQFSSDKAYSLRFEGEKKYNVFRKYF